MSNYFPHFSFHGKNHNKPYGCIKLDGVVIHEIADLNKYYKAVGYNADMAKAGLLPDEYIWEKFVKDTKARCMCFEMSIINYLSMESVAFKNLCESNTNYWSPILALAKIGQNSKCSECKKK